MTPPSVHASAHFPPRPIHSSVQRSSFSLRLDPKRIKGIKELVKTAARAHKLKSDAQNYPVKLAATPWRPDLILVENEDAKCPKRLCPWSRAVMTWFGRVAGVQGPCSGHQCGS